jgi:L-alanine-DL-glutamate epimerase-like enolase superfamily enzyme
MKIMDVKATIVSGNFEWILVKVLTDQDELAGIGEAYWQRYNSFIAR